MIRLKYVISLVSAVAATCSIPASHAGQGRLARAACPCVFDELGYDLETWDNISVFNYGCNHIIEVGNDNEVKSNYFADILVNNIIYVNGIYDSEGFFDHASCGIIINKSRISLSKSILSLSIVNKCLDDLFSYVEVFWSKNQEVAIDGSCPR